MERIGKKMGGAIDASGDPAKHQVGKRKKKRGTAPAAIVAAKLVEEEED